MGKWMSRDKIVPGIEKKKAELTSLPTGGLQHRWEIAGSPVLKDYGLAWHWGSSGEGWACIDDSANRCLFQMFVPRDVGLRDKMDLWEKVATTAAFELGVTKPAVVTDVQPVLVGERNMSSFVPAGDYFSLTSRNFEGHNHRTFKVLRHLHLLDEARKYLLQRGDNVRKVDFIADFITSLLLSGAILELHIVKKLEFTNDIETDMANEDFLKAWLA